ncbi:unnamed protein product [marine sediment metagenome]|uniref:Uncharacterized protein n=1 Tax=marine sediment metagenome TaxID=412755 RepID=X1L4A8_9ZZZZ
MNASNLEGSSAIFLAPVISIKVVHPPRNPSMILGNNWTKMNTAIKATKNTKHKLLLSLAYRVKATAIYTPIPLFIKINK